MFLPEEAGATGAVAEDKQVDRYAEIESVDEEPAAEPKLKTEPAKPEGEAESPEDDEAKRKKGGFTKKLAAKDAEIARLVAQLEGTTKKEPVKAAETAKPQADKFETWDAYYEALADWKVEQGVNKLVSEKLKERDTQAREATLRKEAASLEAQYKAKAEEFAAKQPDFNEVINEYDGPLTPLMRAALVESEVGPQVAYYIASNPAEGERLAQLGAVGLAKAIGRIEAKLEGDEPPEKKPSPKVTNAPPPIKPVNRTSTTASNDPYSSETDHEDYKAWRAKQRKRY